MRLRVRNKCNDENTPTPSGQKTPKAKGKTPLRNEKSCSSANGGGAKALGGRVVLREKTNVSPRGESVCGKRKGEEAGEAAVSALGVESPNDVRPSFKESCGAKGAVVKTPRRRESARASLRLSDEASKGGSTDVGGRRCVYMNAARPSVPATSGKESVYEFEVDGSEPPSRRRRRKRAPNNARKKRGFPKFHRVRFPSRSETTASSVESLPALFSFESTSTAISVPEEKAVPSSAIVASTRDAIPCGVGQRVRKRLSIVPESPPDIPATTPSPKISLANKVLEEDIVADTKGTDDVVVEACSAVTPSKVARASSFALPENVPLNENASFNTSLLSNGNSSFFLGFANIHSTPIKARSATDTSSIFTRSQANTTAEKCFGFSSDEEEAAVDNDGLPSPLPASPNTHAMRQSFLLSSPAQMAPSRFAPEVVRRALVLEAVSMPLQGGGAHPRGQQQGAKFGEGKKRVRKQVGARQRAKELEAITGPSQRIDEYLLKRVGVDVAKDKEPVVGIATPPNGLLFGEDAGEDMAEAAPLCVRPPRRSYERPWNRKLKKVIGGGLCLDSSDEEDNEEREKHCQHEEKEAEPKVPKPQQKAAVKPRGARADNKENQMEQWASQINSQFDEVEDFELCVG
ncbi:uncharacterized protein [Hetaerina americana]|uniref:uncharacterized protein n=1 Tax=Hetaerina americana TaxID=62018 RepID=UPI003A7F1225